MAKVALPVVEAKELVLARLATGMKVVDAMRSVDRSRETYRDWMKNDADFKSAVQGIRSNIAAGHVATTAVPDFPDFCEHFLGIKLPHHHLRVWDVIEGREPQDLRDSMMYQAGAYPGRYMILNMPPDHAKSTVWAKAYCMWRICKDPNVRIGIVSKSQRFARKQLYQIKFWLTNPDLFPALHAAFAPEGGWRSDDKADGLAWREDMIYVRGRNTAEQEPTIEALGIGSQIYGTRFDVLILDDVEDKSSANLYESHADWIGQEVFNRLHPEVGQLIILGTRVGIVDLYRHLRDLAKTEGGDPFYTYFAQPAIVEGETGPSSEWQVLWPERLDATKIARAKSAMTDPRRFSFVYQQLDVPDEATFPAAAVDASVDNRRFHGPMQPEVPGHRALGMHGLYVVGAWDPASSAGRNAFIVVGTDKATRHRWVLDVWTKKGAVPRETIQLLKDWTKRYNINEWRIEKNAVQSFITQLPEIRQFVTGNGCRLVEHQTTGNKWDPDMGVEGCLVPLFLSCVDDIDGRLLPKADGKGLISLPAFRKNSHVSSLMEQLKQWEPENKKLVQDLVMALWFAELGIKKFLRGGSDGGHFARSPFTTRGALKARRTISIDELRQQGLVAA